jgi:hypothetical protein
LIHEVHAADPARLVSAALQAEEKDEGGHTTLQINDPIAADLDVIGNNEYIGWYNRAPDDADTATWLSRYDKPLIMSEFGGDALFGYHADPQTRWTEEYQANLYISASDLNAQTDLVPARHYALGLERFSPPSADTTQVRGLFQPQRTCQ